MPLALKITLKTPKIYVFFCCERISCNSASLKHIFEKKLKFNHITVNVLLTHICVLSCCCNPPLKMLNVLIFATSVEAVYVILHNSIIMSQLLLE